MKTGLWQVLLKGLALLVLGLVLFGIFSGGTMVTVLVVAVVLRLFYLASEFFATPVVEEDWHALEVRLREELASCTGAEREAQFHEFGLAPETTDEEAAAVIVAGQRAGYRPPRAKGELTVEAIGLATFLLLLPLATALWTLTYVSTALPFSWGAFLVVAVCAAAYGLPFRLWKRRRRWSGRRRLWWAVPVVPAVVLCVAGIDLRHPYLSPLQPERLRLEAERVLALDNIVVAGRHADVVARYARHLEAGGRPEEAVAYYHAALRLNPGDASVRTRLLALEGGSAPDERNLGADGPAPTAEPPAPGRIDASLESVDGVIVVVLAVGPVPPDVRTAVARSVWRELNLPVVMVDAAVTLPPHDRRRGLAVGRQWEVEAIAKAFVDSVAAFPRAPVRYVVLTPVDIYGPGMNFVFSTTYQWGCVVSTARYDAPGGTVAERTAKQTLCALIKAFGVPPSTNQKCVTSYSRSLDEFDRKGDRPAAGTLGRFREQVEALDRAWHAHRRNRD